MIIYEKYQKIDKINIYKRKTFNETDIETYVKMKKINKFYLVK